NIAGTMSYRGANNNLTLQNGATIINSGTFSADLITPNGIDGNGTFANNGVFQASGGSGPFTLAPGVAFANTSSGTLLHVVTGTLALQGPFTNSSAAITVESGSTLS